MRAADGASLASAAPRSPVLILVTNAAPRRRVLHVAVAALTCVCAGIAPAQSPAPAVAQGASASSPSSQAATGTAAPERRSDTSLADSAATAGADRAVVASGDRLRIKVWREPGLTDEYVVDDRGDVVLPRLGTMRVAGRTVAGVRDTLVSRFAEYLRNPSVDVTALRRIGVQGEVRAPNLYYVDLTKSVRDVITEAGGVLDTGNRNGISILRGTQRIPLPNWQNGGPVGAQLQSGDQIVVARRSWWSINSLAIVSTLGVIVPVGLSVLSYVRK